MSKIVWDAAGAKRYEMGVDHGVLYPHADESSKLTAKGVAWNGLTKVTESPSGAEPQEFYADNILYASIRSAEKFGATIGAYTYPDEFAYCDGSAEPVPGVIVGQQRRLPFDFSYRTNIGDDETGEDAGYKLHLVYNATVSPSERDRETINDSPALAEFSWEMTTVPVPVKGHKPTAHIEIDSTKVNAVKLKALEDILYGKDAESPSEPRMPTPDEVIDALTEAP